MQALPFQEGTFDVYRAERLLEHAPDPVGALTEMVRVTPAQVGRSSSSISTGIP